MIDPHLMRGYSPLAIFDALTLCVVLPISQKVVLIAQRGEIRAEPYSLQHLMLLGSTMVQLMHEKLSQPGCAFIRILFSK
jgi:hypothetical protein